PGLSVAHLPLLEPAAMLAALLAPRHEASLLEDAHVLGDGRSRDLEWPGQLGDGGLATREPREDAATDRMRQGPECEIEPSFNMVNHVVNYVPEIETNVNVEPAKSSAGRLSIRPLPPPRHAVVRGGVSRWRLKLRRLKPRAVRGNHRSVLLFFALGS